MPARRSWQIVGGCALLAVLALGHWNMQFLTDDAFIAFRYVSNAMLGRGLVWNPEPFLPVEGYSCFSWVVLLWACWAWFGVEPPAMVQPIGLVCGAGILALCFGLCRRIAGDGRAGLVGFAALLAIATHKTFLTWLSSGLETPLYNLCFVWWVYAVTSRGAGACSLAALAAAAAALTRPDGLLLVAATAVFVALRSFGVGRPAGAVRAGRHRRMIGLGVAITVVVGHLAWRRVFYGAWLPNTYYAKVVEPWPESGWRYLAAFIVEHGFWCWALVAVAAAAVACWRHRPFGVRRHIADHLGLYAVISVIVIHIGYYTLRVGGDHFGFRAFSFTVPLMFVALFGFVRVLAGPARRAAGAALIACVAVTTHTVGWVHHVRSSDDSILTVGEVASAFPAPIGPALRHYDRWNAWMHLRFVCIRRPTHIAYTKIFAARCPDRVAGSEIGWEDRPVIVDDTVGLVGWTLPHVAVIDSLGLNDWVVARNFEAASASGFAFSDSALTDLFEKFDRDRNGTVGLQELEAAILDSVPLAREREADLRGLISMAQLLYDADEDGRFTPAEVSAGLSIVGARRMAHERVPPAGYCEGFRPNVRLGGGRAIAEPRSPPLTDAEIRAAERRFR